MNKTKKILPESSLFRTIICLRLLFNLGDVSFPLSMEALGHTVGLVP
jgi:hypothetical protein